MPISERKRVLALLDQRQNLEDEYTATNNESTRTQLDNMNPLLLKYFKVDTVENLLQTYPTTKEMKVAAEKKRYFAPRYVAIRRTSEVYDSIRLRGSDSEFLEFMRISRSVFDSIVTSVLSQQRVFHNQSNNGQVPVEKQLAVTLWRMGHQGNEAGIGNVGRIFGLSEGTVMKCTQRCLTALAEISSDVICWPGHGERKTVKTRIQHLATRGTNTDLFASSTPSFHHQYQQNNPCTNTDSTGENKTIREPRDITDTVGIMSVMKVILVSRPTISNYNDYLIPLPELPLIPSSSTPPPPTSQPPSPTTPANKPNDDAKLSIATSAAGKKRRRVSKKGEMALADGEERNISALPSQNSTSKPKKGKKPSKGKEPPTASQQAPLGFDSGVQTVTEVPGAQEKPLSPATNGILPFSDWSLQHKGMYLKRTYGFSVLLVSDSITRIRFIDAGHGGSKADQVIFEESELFKEPEKYFAIGENVIAATGCAVRRGNNVISSYEGANDADKTGAEQAEEGTDYERTQKTNTSDTLQQESPTSSPSSSLLADILEPISMRAMDCQRTLLARFPSLLELRLQLKDEASQEFARSWVMACIFIHNLVLGDDMCYDYNWETQLQKTKDQLLKSQYEQHYLLQKQAERTKRKNQRSLGKSLPTESGSCVEPGLPHDSGNVQLEDLTERDQTSVLSYSLGQELPAILQGLDFRFTAMGSTELFQAGQFQSHEGPISQWTLSRENETLPVNGQTLESRGELTNTNSKACGGIDGDDDQMDVETTCVNSKENRLPSSQMAALLQPCTVGDSFTPSQRQLYSGDCIVVDECTTSHALSLSSTIEANSIASSSTQSTLHSTPDSFPRPNTSPTPSQRKDAHSLSLLLN